MAEELFKCTRCSASKRREGFYHDKNRAYRDYVSPWCRECTKARAMERREERNAYQKAWREKNTERRQEYQMEYREANKGALAASWKRYYEENREQLLAQGKEHRKRNEQVYRQYQRDRYTRDREAVLAHSRNRRALIRGLGGAHTPDDVWQMVEDQRHLCAYCETPLCGGFHVDHMVPLSRGGGNDWTNLAVTCESCNCRKHIKTTEEFMEVLVA